MSTEPDPYAVLCVTPNAPSAVIAAAYRVLAKMSHPDVAGDASTRRMVALSAAYEAVRDPALRPAHPLRQPPSVVYRDRIVALMPWGRHEGLPLSEVPRDYLRWLSGKPDLRPWLAEAIRAELEARPWATAS